MKKIITFVLLLGMASSVAIFTGCSKVSNNKPSESTVVDTVKVTSNKNTSTNANTTVPEETKENKDDTNKITVVYQGRIDNNSIEIKEGKEISAARLSSAARKFFDENSNLKEGSSILIKYEKNEYGQKVITEVTTK